MKDDTKVALFLLGVLALFVTGFISLEPTNNIMTFLGTYIEGTGITYGLAIAIIVGVAALYKYSGR